MKQHFKLNQQCSKRYAYFSPILQERLFNIVLLIFQKNNVRLPKVQKMAEAFQKNIQLSSSDEDHAFRKYTQICTKHLIERLKKSGESVQSKEAKTMQAVHDYFSENNIEGIPYFNKSLSKLIKDFLFAADKIEVKNMWSKESESWECYCQQMDYKCQKRRCYKCLRLLHADCFWDQDENLQRYWQCSVCFLANCHPEHKVKQILFLGILEYYPYDTVFYNIRFDVDIKNIKDEDIFEVRSARLSKQKRFEINFAENCKWSFQKGEKAQFGPFRRINDQPIAMQKKNLIESNTILITESHPYKLQQKNRDSHLVMIARARKESANDFSCNIRDNPLQVLEKEMQKNNDSIKQISLLCHCSKKHQILTPVCSTLCLHYQPLNLQCFLKKKSENGLFKKCPICNIRMYDIAFDEVFHGIVEKNPQAKSVKFDSAGKLLEISNQEVQIALYQSETLKNNENLQKKSAQSQIIQSQNASPGIKKFQSQKLTLPQQKQKNQESRTFYQKKNVKLEEIKKETVKRAQRTENVNDYMSSEYNANLQASKQNPDSSRQKKIDIIKLISKVKSSRKQPPEVIQISSDEEQNQDVQYKRATEQKVESKVKKIKMEADISVNEDQKSAKICKKQQKNQYKQIDLEEEMKKLEQISKGLSKKPLTIEHENELNRMNLNLKNFYGFD